MNIEYKKIVNVFSKNFIKGGLVVGLALSILEILSQDKKYVAFYALVSSGFVILWGEAGFWAGLPIAIGIFVYGLSYFVVHDIFIHQRFKILRNINNKYARGLRRAHKMHHKNIHKEKGECFGMLWVPTKYFK